LENILMNAAKILFCLIGFMCFAGCGERAQPSAAELPITPSESGECQAYRAQLQRKVASATQGDAAEMYALGIFYMVCDGKDSEGELWIERSADAGLEKAQKYILAPLEESESAADHVRAKELREKWKLPQP
jgi:hypothetical protein